MKHILIAFTAIFLLIGCTTTKPTNSSNSSIQKDSTTIIIVRDTFINWLPQKQEVKTNQKSKLATDFSFSLAWIDSVGILNHSIENFQKVPSKIIEKKVIVNKSSKLIIEKEITITKKVTEYKTNWFGKFDFAIIGLVLIYLLWKLKLFFKI